MPRELGRNIQTDFREIAVPYIISWMIFKSFAELSKNFQA